MDTRSIARPHDHVSVSRQSSHPVDTPPHNARGVMTVSANTETGLRRHTGFSRGGDLLTQFFCGPFFRNNSHPPTHTQCDDNVYTLIIYHIIIYFIIYHYRRGRHSVIVSANNVRDLPRSKGVRASYIIIYYAYTI